MPVISVTSLDDTRLDDYRNVPDPELLVARGIFIAEGRLVVRRLLERSRFTARSLLVTPTAHTALTDIAPHLMDLPVYVAEQRILHGVTGFNLHRGCLAIGERGDMADWQQVASAVRTVVVLEGVGNPDNVGALFRNAAALGAGAMLIGPGCADPLYRKAIRTSMGAALQVPFAPLPDWLDSLAHLRATGFHLAALTPEPGAARLHSWAARVPVGDRVALLAGHEGTGLSSEALAMADARVCIPMANGTDSLNVATATALALHALQQRSANPD